MIAGKDYRYKIFWIGSDSGNSGVGILLAEECIEKVYDISRISNCHMTIKLVINNNINFIMLRSSSRTG